MSEPFRLRLKYPATCRLCGRDLEPGTKAWWSPTNQHAICISCDIRQPADPYEGIDPTLLGTPGGSAQAECDRRGGQPGASSWGKGAAGERRLSNLLHQECDWGTPIVLEDRRVGITANIDHIAIVPTGVYVIDAKNWAGRVELKVERSGGRQVERLMVNGWDQTDLVSKMEWQIDAVRAALDGTDVPITPVVCFVGEDNWGRHHAGFDIAGVEVLPGGLLTELVRRNGSVNLSARIECGRLISIQLPPAFQENNRKAG